MDNAEFLQEIQGCCGYNSFSIFFLTSGSRPVFLAVELFDDHTVSVDEEGGRHGKTWYCRVTVLVRQKGPGSQAGFWTGNL